MQLLLFFILFSSSAFSQDCGKEVDLNTTAPLREMPITDQDGSGLCYAYAGAQVVEFEMRERGTAFNVSPVDLSMKAGEGIVWDRDKLSGGIVKHVIDSAKSNGVAKRECVAKQISTLAKNNSMSESQFVHLLELIYDKHEWKAFEDDEYYSLMDKLLDEKIAGDMGNQYDHLKNCKYDRAVRGLQKLGMLGSSVTDILQKLLEGCKSRDVYNFNYSEFYRSEKNNDEKMVKSLDEILDRGKPATMYLCAGALKANHKENLYVKKDDSCGHHALLAVGRRTNKGACEYLLRNSWGSQWSPPGVSCACKTPSGKYYSDCKTFTDSINDEMFRLDLIKDDPTQVKEYREGVKAHEEMRQQYLKRTVVGCWFPSKNLIQNTYGVGGVK